MRLLNLRINFSLLRTFCPHLGSFFLVFLCCFFFHYVSAKFHLSCCLSHHVFDQVNLWSAWVGFETAIFWQCSPGTVETQRLYPLRQRFIWSKTWCNRQQLWKAVITGNTVTRLIIPIRGHSKITWRRPVILKN